MHKIVRFALIIVFHETMIEIRRNCKIKQCKTWYCTGFNFFFSQSILCCYKIFHLTINNGACMYLLNVFFCQIWKIWNIECLRYICLVKIKMWRCINRKLPKPDFFFFFFFFHAHSEFSLWILFHAPALLFDVVFYILWLCFCSHFHLTSHQLSLIAH